MASSDDATNVTPPPDYESARSSLAQESENMMPGTEIDQDQLESLDAVDDGQDETGGEIGEVREEIEDEAQEINGDDELDDLAPIGRGIAISNQAKRSYKDRRIYLNQRTGLPVRPPSSFGLFKHALRRKIKEDKVDFKEFNKKAIEEWKELSASAKERYVQRSRLLTTRFKKIEVACLRKRVRQLQKANREIARENRNYY